MMKMVDDDEFSVSKETHSKVNDGGGSGESNLFPKRKMMMADDDAHNHHCSFTFESGWRGVGSGPTCNRPKTSSSSSIGDVIGVGGGGVATCALNTLQPFDIVAGAAATAVSQTALKSPGGYMGFPFTNAQWKELERQAMIYKYMMASLPVPPQLLFPFLTTQSPLVGCGLNLIRLSNGGDLEPGRCRRTDGKKWRCSRDVAPDQKYCERHLHRGRHRSRKPVELPPKNSTKARLEFEPNPPLPTQSSAEKASIFDSLEQQRCLDWTIKAEQWQSGSLSAGCNQNMVVSLENQHQIETPSRGFIDAWPNRVSHNYNNNSNSNSVNISFNGNLSLSPLTLSMGGTDTNADLMGQTGHHEHECSSSSTTSTKLPFSNWSCPGNWVGSTPGGPLAEVLRSSTVNGESNTSPQASTLSSPSGVLQKTLGGASSSWSDSSGSSSPTLGSLNVNHNRPVELSLLWLNQGKSTSST